MAWVSDMVLLFITSRQQVTEMLLCADTVPESVLRRAVEVLASQCYTKVLPNAESTMIGLNRWSLS